MICHSLLQWTTFGWPCTIRLKASLSYTKLWSIWSFYLAFLDCGFPSGGYDIIVLTSVWPLMDEKKRLVQASLWEELAVGKTESCSGGQDDIQHVFLRLPCGSNGKESACNVGDQSSIPMLGSSSGEGNGNPLQYCCLENSIGRSLVATVRRVSKSWTRLTHTHTHTHTHTGGQGPAQQILNPIVCWWVGLYFLPVSCLAWGDSILEYIGSTVGLLSDLQKGLLLVDTSQDCCLLPYLLMETPWSGKWFYQSGFTVISQTWTLPWTFGGR